MLCCDSIFFIECTYVVCIIEQSLERQHFYTVNTFFDMENITRIDQLSYASQIFTIL